MVECDFHYAGCEIKLPRKDMSDHLKDDLVTHISLLVVSHKKQQDKIKAHQEEIRALTEEVNELKKQLRLHTHNTVPIDFVVTNADQCHVFSKWTSAPFYSHSQGYKLRLSFYKALTAYRISCDLMQGEYDSILKWPLKAVMKLTLHQQLQGEDRELSIELSCKKRVGDGVDISENCGFRRLGFDLSPYLIPNNCLQIKIVSIQF